MYAIIRAGGKQQRVEVGQVVRVERMPAEVGAAVAFDDVLLVGEADAVRVGNPTVAGAKVRGSVVAQDRAKKIVIYTYKKRQNSNRKRAGHRQDYTAVKIEAIEA